ncbi:centromere protein P-like [Gigantopelta aegis]|uniref:centromere protein P-like n=1 Tax=Gigantopelta aegis TaxID=1735272 RepID=UPI001B8884F5|nr:centromere protein P-like [Gigantopelta aegis]
MENVETREMSQLQEKCRTQISSLETEIEKLEQQLNQREHVALGKTGWNMENMRKSKMIARSAKGKTVNEVKSQITSVQEKIKLMEEITGVTVDEANWKVISEDGSVVTRQHIVEGLVYTTPFILQFTVQEDFASTDSAPILSDLVCMIDDNIVKFLEHPLDRIVEDTEIEGFFIIMTSYMKWFKEKEKIFQHFIDKFPTIVSRLRSLHNELKIENEHNLSPVFVLKWNLTVNSCHHVNRNLTLSVKAPHNMLKLDEGKTLASTPSMFSSMVEKLGVERAIYTLVQLVQGR